MSMHLFFRNYRGAAPIQWAIIEGESVTGVTTMQMDEGLDTGDMILKDRDPDRQKTRQESRFMTNWQKQAPLSASKTLHAIENKTAVFCKSSRKARLLMRKCSRKILAISTGRNRQCRSSVSCVD